MFIIRRVQGESMVPALKPGKLVVGTKVLKSLKIGDIVIIRHDNLEKIKRIHALDKANIYVVGDNLESSKDSRHFGPILRGNILAKVIIPVYLRRGQPPERLLLKK
jgi:nickel-type superoxide dismutase maturation protease